MSLKTIRLDGCAVSGVQCTGMAKPKASAPALAVAPDTQPVSPAPPEASAQASAEAGVQAAPPPPPDIAAAYAELEARYVKLASDNAQLRASCAHLDSALKAEQSAAEGYRKAAAAAGSKAEPFENDRFARRFLYIKGDPKNPKAPRHFVKAHNQKQADEILGRRLGAAAAEFKFRGASA